MLLAYTSFPQMSLLVCGEQSLCLSDLSVLHGVIAANACHSGTCQVLVELKFTATHSPLPSSLGRCYGEMCNVQSREGPVVNLYVLVTQLRSEQARGQSRVSVPLSHEHGPVRHPLLEKILPVTPLVQSWNLAATIA